MYSKIFSSFEIQVFKKCQNKSVCDRRFLRCILYVCKLLRLWWSYKVEKAHLDLGCLLCNTYIKNITTTCSYIFNTSFNEIPSFGYLGKVEDRKNSLIFRQLKGNNSSMNDDTLLKLNMHSNTIVIYIQYK